MEAVMTTAGLIAHALGSVISGGTFTIISIPSATVRAEGQAVYRGPLRYTFAGGNSSGFDPGTVATTVPQIIQPTAVKVSADGLKVIRENDTGQMAAVGTVSGTPTAVVGPVEVSDAGQDKVQAE